MTYRIAPAAWRTLVAALLLTTLTTACAQTEEEEEPVEEVPEPPVEGYDPGAAGFAVETDEIIVPYEVFGLFVEPGETIPLEPRLEVGDADWAASAEGGTLQGSDEGPWRWTAPEQPGLYPITVTNEDTGEDLTLNAFVQVPFDHTTDALEGYRIGQYAEGAYQGNPRYERPQWFVRLTPELVDARVSPHFTLGQFVAKQASDWPKYLLVQEGLLLKLERILQALNQAGVDAETFTVMSGYRTPFYNRSIGNRTSRSRHLYGDAADIYVDDDGDSYMDDLNEDGEVTEADAHLLAEIVEAQRDEPWYAPFVGGLGVYGPAPHRGPFIHVDTRGEPVRW